MAAGPRGLSRRFFLQALTALAGAAAVPAIGSRRAFAGVPDLPSDIGRGRKVAVIGAGMAGLTAGWTLARHGFRVTIYEADGRYGGRSLTARPVRKEYRDWWFSKYDPQQQFPAMYVSEFKEDPARSPDPQPQVCRFDDTQWDPQSGNPPVELFLNVGPGRIPSDHMAVIDMCRRIGVGLEPYIFVSTSNLLQSDSFNGGLPITLAQAKYSLMGQIAEQLAGVIKEGHALGQYSDAYRHKMLEMLKSFGDLNAEYRYNGSSRLGFSRVPGGWRDAGVLNPVAPLKQLLDSGFVDAGNPDTSLGSFVFNSDTNDWQTSLMQPIGGMDRIWQRLLVQEVPKDALLLRNDDPRAKGVAARDAATKGGRRYVGDLVVLNHKATGIHDDPAENRIRIDYAWTDPATGKTGTGSDVADFCVCTMAPNLLAVIPTSLPGWFRSALAAVNQTPAFKVGWQGRTRFWETENHIFGGISWTQDMIGQIWYPSEDFNAHTGVLTGAYNRGPIAAVFGQYNQARRIQIALAGGEKLHAGFSQKVFADKGLTVAWQNMPNQVGGWATETAESQPEIYRTITTLPQGRLYLAGDTYSYWPGWKEGAITSAYAAVKAIAYGLSVADVGVGR